MVGSRDHQDLSRYWHHFKINFFGVSDASVNASRSGPKLWSRPIGSLDFRASLVVVLGPGCQPSGSKVKVGPWCSACCWYLIKKVKYNPSYLEDVTYGVDMSVNRHLNHEHRHGTHLTKLYRPENTLSLINWQFSTGTSSTT